MTQRCSNPKHKTYAEYGGSGVTVCDRWLSFDKFLADMGEKPVGASIDRLDNSKGYEPGNCRWATTIQQANNKTNNRLIEFRGETRTVSQWARVLGITQSTLSYRLQHGWSEHDALATPVRRS